MSFEGLPAAAVRIAGKSGFEFQGQAPHARSDYEQLWFTGRIFDAAGLARELSIEPLATTELLLHAYRRWGIAFPAHLEGEYAFALWDHRARRLLLGRDASGYWPLLYAQQGETLVFADRIQSIVEWPGITMRLNQSRIAEWLGLAFRPTNETFFENVLSVPPGSIVLFENGLTTQHTFWRPEDTPRLRLRDSREYVDGLVAVLERSVQDRLPQTSAVGSHLSGGLDSSSVMATAARLMAKDGRGVFAFTAVPAHKVELPGTFTDEGPHAAAVAAMYPNVEHVLIRHGSHSPLSLIDSFSTAQEEPVFNPVNYDWMYESCLQARQRGLTELLIGFCGNNTISYDGGRVLSTLASEGRFLTFLQIARTMHRQGVRRWRGIAREFAEPWLPIQVRYALGRSRGKKSGTEEYSLIHPEFRRSSGIGIMALEQTANGLDSRSLRLLLLRRQDLGSTMRAFRQLTGISMTDPTADHRVIEYCLSVPVEYFYENAVPRSLIRKAMVGRLPEHVRTERRRGRQAADFGLNFGSGRQEVLAEISRLKKVDLAAKAIDLAAMEGMMAWPQSQVQAFDEALFWVRLLRALSLGRFLRRFEEGSLFSPSAESLDTAGRLQTASSTSSTIQTP